MYTLKKNIRKITWILFKMFTQNCNIASLKCYFKQNRLATCIKFMLNTIVSATWWFLGCDHILFWEFLPNAEPWLWDKNRDVQGYSSVSFLDHAYSFMLFFLQTCVRYQNHCITLLKCFWLLHLIHVVGLPSIWVSLQKCPPFYEKERICGVEGIYVHVVDFIILKTHLVC